ncbi:alpha/beta hydrolase [Halorubellus sp. JP-L1]|uniref:alpha/beta hydrolase family protein n=1 Tax=Halorubellus sp. JP-L1 TaxID=2715753 RepID=UPI00140D6A34|nr:alpha/beta hydrolase [Halorubellus sp. JP-L1]NHN40651.1 alpha/beta hydrolase [Halorubellus sp. JP-L1]
MTRTRKSTETVREFATLFLDGSFEDAAASLSDDGRDAVVDSFPAEFGEAEMDAADALEAYWFGLHSLYGDPEGVDASVVDDEATVEFAFADGTETATVCVADDGVAGFSFDPSYEPPAYADRDAFTERETTVDAGDVELDGVLTVPEGEGQFPAVVLVHGAGMHDPDGGDGAYKLLRDVAWGLASEGIATLRYANRQAEHEVPDDEYTLDRVVVDDAVAALDALAAVEGVDDDALFVAGHSQGGMAAPRIAERYGDVAGIVNLDGPPRPILDPEDADIIKYEFDRDGDLDEEQQAQLEEDRETYRRLNAGEFDDDETLMGRPGSWFRSLLAYDPTATASDLDAPVFVANTHVVDPDEKPEIDAFLRKNHEGWRTADLPAGSRVELYEGLSHLLQPAHEPWTPVSLYFGGNVSERVVADVAEWIDAAATR